jgi:FlaA1/EpsC-like NDP-sugar epimerase
MIMYQQLKNPKFYIMILCDVVIFVMAHVLAYMGRFEFVLNPSQIHQIQSTLLWLIPLKVFIFFGFGLYRGMWRYTSIRDLQNLLHASVLSTLLVMAVILYLHRFIGYSRSVFLMDGVLTFILSGGFRVLVRVYYLRHSNVGPYHVFDRSKGTKKRLLVVGAGSAGEKVIREIQENPGIRFDPVGFLDDDWGKWGKAIHGVPVWGRVDDIEKHVDKYDEIVIAIPSIRGGEMRRIVDLCEKTGKRIRTVPGIGELIEGKVSVKAIRDVTLGDLLGRDEVRLDEEGIREYLKDKRVLVTGAGGSIGSELVRQVCKYHPAAVGLVDFSELNLFRVEMECRQTFSFIAVSSYLADIRRRGIMERVIKGFNPAVIFHAAAYKHVPIQEQYPWEAVRNNVCGTRNMVELALENGVQRFVMVSTDKAVRPTNVMGATKRVAELLATSSNGNSRTRFMAVRFGNVIGSSGSALPLFQEQIARGGPVTVTHPEITRYFMSIPEAAQLILQTGAMGEGGEIFILDMGKSIKVLDMVKDLIRLSGFEPEKDIPIQFIGLRPGEKLYEELITEGEGIVPTNHEKILVLRGNSYDKKCLDEKIDELIAVAGTHEAVAIKKKLQEIVPEYTPQ